MKTTGALSSYHDGIMTDEYLYCSNPDNEVNHGILIVGYGTVTDDYVMGGGC